jgi:hypothetical protein
MTIAKTAPAAPQTSFAASGAWPQVDLLPPEVRARRKLARTKRQLLLGIAAVVVLSAFAFVAVSVAAVTARTDLANVQRDNDVLMAEQAKYSEVPLVLGQIAATKTAREMGFSTEILWKPFVDALRAVTPAGVTISDLTVTVSTPTQAAAPSNDPLAGPAVGTIAFNGTAATPIDTSAWLDALDSLPGFNDPWFSTESIKETPGGGLVYEIGSTVQITDEVFAQRFVEEEGK